MKSFLWFFFVLKLFLYFCRLIYCQEDLVPINSTSEYFFKLEICAFTDLFFTACGPLTITNEAQFNQLEPCATINGSLTFTSFTYSKVSFPDLLYIKGSLEINNIDNLLSFKQLLPNLIHIQGTDIALSITDNKDLEKLEFKRLLKIDDGVVVIKDNPRLCLNDSMSWLQMQENISPIKSRIQV